MKKGLVAGLGDAAPILNDPNQADQQLATDAFDAEEATMMDERRRWARGGFLFAQNANDFFFHFVPLGEVMTM